MYDEECYRTVRTALDIGYRHIDGADRYGNSAQIGQALIDSGIGRSDVWITSKLWVDCFGPVGRSLAEMHAKIDRDYSLSPEQLIIHWLESELIAFQTDYLDLVLLHWPTSISEHHVVFDVLRILQSQGKIRHIGISNFSYSQFDDALSYLGNDLFAVQYEYHVCLDQSYLVDRCRQHNIVFEAYSPLAHGKLRNDKQTVQILQDIANKYKVTMVDVML